MAGPGITIVIDSYNHEAFVAEAVRSALAQDYEPLQVVVVDDGSTDGTMDVLQALDGDFQLISQANRGQVACCRTGFAHARHDIVIFLDSDDRLAPHAAQRIAATWTAKTAKIQWALEVIDGDGRCQGAVFPKYRPGLDDADIRKCWRRCGNYPDSPTSGNAYSRALLAAMLPRLPRPNGIDGELNGTAPLFGEVLTIAEPLGAYRIHGYNGFAQAALDPGRFDGYCEHSKKRFAFVQSEARRHGILIDDCAFRRDLKFIEYALVAQRLGSAREARSVRIGEILQACLIFPGSWQERWLRGLWCCAVFGLPRPLAKILIEQRFVPGRRWPVLRKLAG